MYICTDTCISLSKGVFPLFFSLTTTYVCQKYVYTYKIVFAHIYCREKSKERLEFENRENEKNKNREKNEFGNSRGRGTDVRVDGRRELDGGGSPGRGTTDFDVKAEINSLKVYSI